MRNYELMRSILMDAQNGDLPLSYGDICHEFSDEELKFELERLNEEGLIKSDFAFNYGRCASGKLTKITEDGKMFVRNIANKKVWALVYQTLKKADLDLSYPLLKEVCDEVVRRYVMDCIPEKLHYTN